LELYHKGALSSTKVASTIAKVATTTTKKASTTTVAVTSGTGFPAGWANYGCYVDGVDGRILNNQQPDNQALTQQSCVKACAAAGYTIAGMEYSVQCFCDVSWLFRSFVTLLIFKRMQSIMEVSLQLPRAIAAIHAVATLLRYVGVEIE
jgi:hypothetical protein